MVKIDPLLPLRPLSNSSKQKVVTGRDLLEKEGHERLVVPGSIDLKRFPGLAAMGSGDEAENGKPDAAPAG